MSAYHEAVAGVGFFLLLAVVLTIVYLTIPTFGAPKLPRPPKVRATGTHHAGRRTRRAEARAQDDQWVTFLQGIVRPLRRARDVQPLAVAPRYDDAPPLDFTPCPSCGGGPSDLHGECAPCCDWPGCGVPVTTGCAHTPGPFAGWDTDEARAELVPLPPMPVDLARLAGEYGDLFSRPAEPKVVELTVVDPPPAYTDELRARLAATVALPGPNARAGNWQPRAAVAVLDWDPATDDPGLIHLRYQWADQTAADFDPAVAR